MNTAIKITTLLFALVMSLTSVNGQQPAGENNGGNRQYVKVEVDGLACPFCAYGLEKKLTNIEGQKELYIDIENGFATFHVPDSSTITKAGLREVVENAGFSAREITFAQEPLVNDQRRDE